MCELDDDDWNWNEVTGPVSLDDLMKIGDWDKLERAFFNLTPTQKKNDTTVANLLRVHLLG